MDEGPQWFAPKRFGIGSGLPIRWQGWAITILFLAYAFVVSRFFSDDMLVSIALMAPAIVLFLTVVAKTTRGGWRWRWGAEDDD